MHPTSEQEWLARLASVPMWTPPDQPILILAPHPDDETLGGGGLISHARRRDLEVRVAAVTDGEKAYGEMPGLAEQRRLEQDQALAKLGVETANISRFGLPDSDVASHQEELIERLIPCVSVNTHLITTWSGDLHPDHQTCGHAAEEVTRRVGALLSSYFFWTWNWGTADLISHLKLVRFPLSQDLLREKSEALSCHASQLVRRECDPILPESLLASARRPFEIFAMA